MFKLVREALTYSIDSSAKVSKHRCLRVAQFTFDRHLSFHVDMATDEVGECHKKSRNKEYRREYHDRNYLHQEEDDDLRDDLRSPGEAIIHW